jgi:hypothetical protein
MNDWKQRSIDFINVLQVLFDSYTSQMIETINKVKDVELVDVGFILDRQTKELSRLGTLIDEYGKFTTRLRLAEKPEDTLRTYEVFADKWLRNILRNFDHDGNSRTRGTLLAYEEMWERVSYQLEKEREILAKENQEKLASK